MGVAWHVDHFAYLCERLKSIPDGNGTLLDSSAIVFATEHGWGFDPSTQGENRAHSPTNFVMLVGGHAGGLSGGKHIDGAERHPAQTIVSAMEAVGAPGALGAIGNNIPELFT